MPTKILFYPVWVSQSGRVSLRWGKPCNSPTAAKRVGREKVQSGEASVSFVVRFGDRQKTPLLGFVFPESAQKLIGHWEALWEATEPAEEE